MTSPFTIFYFLLFFATLPQQITSNRLSKTQNLIDKACDHTLYRNLCKAVLRSDPRSKTYNLAKLTHVILTTASSNSSYIRDHIHEMVRAKNNKSNKKCLRDCYDQYRDAADRMVDSISAVDSKGYDDVNTWITAAMSGADSCEEGYRGRTGHESPISAMNRIFSRLCSIGLTFVRILGRV